MNNCRHTSAFQETAATLLGKQPFNTPEYCTAPGQLSSDTLCSVVGRVTPGHVFLPSIPLHRYSPFIHASSEEQARQCDRWWRSSTHRHTPLHRGNNKVTRLRIQYRASIPAKWRNFFLRQHVQTVLGSHYSTQWVQRSSSLRWKLYDRNMKQTTRFHPSSSVQSTLPHVVHGAVNTTTTEPKRLLLSCKYFPWFSLLPSSQCQIATAITCNEKAITVKKFTLRQAASYDPGVLCTNIQKPGKTAAHNWTRGGGSEWQRKKSKPRQSSTK
jgi:hypothetical protein